MKKRTIERRFLEESAGRVLGELMDAEGEPGVMKFAERKVTLEQRSKLPVTITAAAMGARGGLRGVMVLEAEDAIISTLELYVSMAEEFGIPAVERLAYAEEKTVQLFDVLFGRIGEALALTLDVLLNEALIVSSHITQHRERVEGGGGLPPLDRESCSVVLEHLSRYTRRRLEARGPGGEARVPFAEISRAIITHGGEDAKAKDVADALEISDRQLRNIRDGFGFTTWADFKGYVVRAAGGNEYK